MICEYCFGVNMKVLLVDDSSAMRRILETQLRELGVTSIVHAGNGRDALDQLGRNMPLDYILLDWNMPIMDGFSCLKKIRANPLFAKVKVIMCTTECEKTLVLDALKSGANNFIVKPFDRTTLKEKLSL